MPRFAISCMYLPPLGRLKRITVYFFTCYACFLSFQCKAQVYDTLGRFSQPIALDTFVLKSGFDINAFIRRVRTDTTFYKAFKSLHLVQYCTVSDFKAYDKNGNEVATMHGKTKQEVANHCRITKIADRQTAGDFLKRNGDYNYYTAGLFASLFFSDTPVCNENDIVAGSLDVHGKGQMEKNKYELKQLIFNPGSKVSGVPFMGDRASIFEPGEAEKYNFKIVQELYDGQECFVFKITPRPGYEHNVIYDELTTWFRKSDYSIVARNYSLSYHTLFYDFDVRMKVRTTQIDNKLYPTNINYDGDWHVFTKKRERVKFNVEISYPNP